MIPRALNVDLKKCLACGKHGQTGPDSPLSKQSKEAQIILQGSVGLNCSNIAADVRRVQQALNEIPPEEGGTADGPLVVDGDCGRLTRGAVKTFQEAQFGQGSKWADGRMDQWGPSLHRLNELHLMITVDPYRIPMLFNFVDRATACVRAAQMNLTMARPFLSKQSGSGGTISVFSRKERLRLLNRHFDFDLHPNPQAVFTEIESYIRLMATALTPKLDHLSGKTFSAENYFTIDPVPRQQDSGATAYTYPGGFHTPLKLSRDFFNQRQDRIYLCTRIDSAPDERKMRGIIHELAHFVGKPSYVDGIDDHCYGIPSEKGMKDLVPWQKLHNADNYANFALECGLGKELTAW